MRLLGSATWIVADNADMGSVALLRETYFPTPAAAASKLRWVPGQLPILHVFKSYRSADSKRLRPVLIQRVLSLAMGKWELFDMVRTF